jgi:hypothetical protein
MPPFLTSPSEVIPTTPPIDYKGLRGARTNSESFGLSLTSNCFFKASQDKIARETSEKPTSFGT